MAIELFPNMLKGHEDKRYTRLRVDQSYIQKGRGKIHISGCSPNGIGRSICGRLGGHSPVKSLVEIYPADLSNLCSCCDATLLRFGYPTHLRWRPRESREGRSKLLLEIDKAINDGGLRRVDYEKKRHLLVAAGVNVEGYVKTRFALGSVEWRGDRLRRRTS